MLKAENLSFSYQSGSRILKELNIIVESGEFTGIIGPNGSGKSTFIKNICNLFHPDSGVIYLNSRRLNQMSAGELARSMAVVPQETNISFNFTVYDLIMMGRNPYQDRWGRIDDEDRKKVEEAMRLTDVRDFRDKTIDQLSGGERQRVIIARALAQSPEILLLDEPTSSLDINYQGEIFDLLSYLNRERDLTIIVVSHDLNLSGQYCQRLILLKDGRVYTSGSPGEVLTEDNINEVYEARVIVEDNQLTGRPFISIMPREQGDYLEKLEGAGRVHVICGGGNAQKLLQRLYHCGFKVSCGILNQGDSDWDLARRLGFEIVDIPPFAYIEEEDLSKNRERLSECEVILVADLPFGHGNAGNLLQLQEVEDKEIIFLQRRSIEERDYTDGKAAAVWESLISRDNTHTVSDVEEMIERTSQLITETD